MTDEQREDVAMLLRCAAENAITRHDPFGFLDVAANRLGSDWETVALALDAMHDAARKAPVELNRVLLMLEAAQLVEEGAL